MDSGSSASHVYVCPKHPFRYVAGKHRFSLRYTADYVIIDIHYSIFGGWLLVSSLGFARCKE
jgi:hypothetical protein